MHRLTFCMHRHLMRTRSRISGSKHTPITSAAMAVPTFKSTRDFGSPSPTCPVDPFDHHATPAFPVAFGTTKPEAFHRLPCFRITASVNNNFPLSFGSRIGPVIGFLIVFPEDVFHLIVNLRDGICDLPFPPRVQCLLDLADSSSVLLSQRILTIDPLTCHLAVATKLYCRLLFTCVDGCVRQPQVARGVIPLAFFPFPAFSFLCTTVLTLSSASVTIFVLSASAHFSFFHSSNLPCPPSPFQFCPRRFQDCATSTHASISCCCTGRLSSLLLAWFATTLYFSI